MTHLPPGDPIVRPPPPRFAQVGRAPPGGAGAWSRGLMLFVAVGVFLSLVALLWELQRAPERLRAVEVTFMEEEAAAAEAERLGAGEVPAAPAEASRH
ncbi:hypothetical protein L6R53_22070 [Myxococcota bacterium]|nr:hypothetical protein [Myxococcota bacterium]